MNYFLLGVIFNFYVKGYLSSDSSSVKIDYYLPEGILKIVIIYNYKEKDYIVAEYKNPFPEKKIKDCFIWATTGKWRKKGNLKIKVFYTNGEKEYFISGENLPIWNFKNEVSSFQRNESLVEIEKGHWIDPLLIKVYKGSDIYSWRTFAYDPQHTGYYPFPLYPPLEWKWNYIWGELGTWVTMISGSCAHGMLFIGKGDPGWNRVRAMEIATGRVIWEKTLTSNVWTTALDPCDSVLFVGTSIGFLPESFPTFFALDPFTGKEKWSKIIETVEFQPVCIDTFVYAPVLGTGAPGAHHLTFAFTLKGKLMWVKPLVGDASPAYFENKIYGARNEVHGLPDPVIFYCRDWLNGDSIWGYRLEYIAWWPSIYNNKVFFFSWDTLYGLNVFSGLPQLKIIEPRKLNNPIRAYNKEIWIAHGEYGPGDTIFTWVRSFDSQNGNLRLSFYLAPKDKDAGRCSDAVFTEGNIRWVNNADYIYVFNTQNGLAFDTILLPESQAIWPSWGFPIIYKNYFITAHEEMISVFKADTILPDTNIHYVFNFYPYYDSFGNIFLYLSLNKDEKVSIYLLDKIGRKIYNLYSGYFKMGEYFLPLNIELCSGVYFCGLKTSSIKRIKKIIKIGR